MSPLHRNDGEISAVGRAAAVLREFRAGSGTLSAATLVRRTGLPKSTVHRMLRELVRVGLLERTGAEFRLGMLLFELGQLVPRQRDLREAARPHMAALHEATAHNVNLAVLAGEEVVYVEIFHGRDGPRLPQRTGGRWPAHASCSGKVILAFSGQEQVRAVTAHKLRQLTDRTITEPSAFLAELERTRRRGIAYDREESFPAVVGVATPITGPMGGVVGALSISGLAGRLNLTRVDAAVRAGGLAISRELERALSIVPSVLDRPAYPGS